MTRSVLRMVLTTLALVLLFASSLNLNRSSANAEPIAGEEADGSDCFKMDCPLGGPYACATLILPDGTKISCGMPKE